MAETSENNQQETSFNTNAQPSFHILISLIEIWTPLEKKKPNTGRENGVTRICEVEEVEISDSYKQLIGTASVRFPRGTIIRKTIVGNNADNVTVNLSDSGVIEETRQGTYVASASTFSVGQRIKIYLGYTEDPKIAELAKTNNTGKSIYNDDETYNTYLDSFYHTAADAKKYMSLAFDGFITKVSVDTPIELECENLASVLKTITCPKVKLKKCEVKTLLGSEGKYKLLENTGLILHPDTANMNFDLGGVELSSDLTVADVLMEWAKFGLFCYVGEYNGQPAIQIGRAYFSNPEKDSLLNASANPSLPQPVHFDYHVANNGLSLTSSDKQFLAVEAKGIDKDDKFISITVLRNPDFDSTKSESEKNPKYRYVNESSKSKKALKSGASYITGSPNDKVDMKLYTKVAFVSKKIPITMDALSSEAVKYLEGYNMNGIEGSLTLFGDLHLKTAQKVQLIDNRYKGKNGIYLVEEVHTTFGTDGFRQKITLPYCVKRDGTTTETSN